MEVCACANCTLHRRHPAQNMYYTIRMWNKWISCARTILSVNIWFKFLFRRIFSFCLAHWSMVSKVDAVSLLLMLLLLRQPRTLHRLYKDTHTMLYYISFNFILYLFIRRFNLSAFLLFISVLEFTVQERYYEKKPRPHAKSKIMNVNLENRERETPTWIGLKKRKKKNTSLVVEELRKSYFYVQIAYVRILECWILEVQVRIDKHSSLVSENSIRCSCLPFTYLRLSSIWKIQLVFFSHLSVVYPNHELNTAQSLGSFFAVCFNCFAMKTSCFDCHISGLFENSWNE